MADNTFVNPFLEENFASGGGLWDGKTVTVIGSKTEIERLSFGDGSPVLDKKTGEQSIRNVWSVIGIAEDDERERKETYSLGGLIPTADGEGFTRPDGTPGVLHKNSEAAKFAAALKASGFDVASLFDMDTGKIHVDRLVGARIVFKGEARLDKDGKPKVNKKGYEQLRFMPESFLGMKDGVGAAKVGPSEEDLAFAVETITGILAEGGGSMGRADIVRAVTTKLNGDPRGPQIVQQILKPEFHASAPWTLDGTTLSL